MTSEDFPREIAKCLSRYSKKSSVRLCMPCRFYIVRQQLGSRALLACLAASVCSGGTYNDFGPNIAPSSPSDDLASAQRDR